ncbi:MAG: ABC transporter permease [Candidatus Thorarchaeota archaeon]
MSLIKYLIKRIFTLIPVVIGIIILTFFISRIIPGDPVLAYLGESYEVEVYERIRHDLWLDRPLPVQFLRYIKDIFTGNWGYSISINAGQEVWSLIIQRLPRTIDIAIFSLIIAVYLGVKTGTISSRYKNTPSDALIRSFALIGVSIPVFFLGVIFQYFFVILIPIFPSTGFKNITYRDPKFITGFRIIDSLISGELYLITDYLFHLILPVFCLTLVTLANITRQSRSSMLEVLGQDYIRTARAKGVREKDVIRTHALKNSLIPTITVVSLNFASLIAGTFLIEATFSINGIGTLLIDALFKFDYWVTNAVIFIVAILFIIFSIINDIAYAIVDPRIRY